MDFHEIVSQLFSVNVILNASDESRRLIKRKYNTESFAAIMNQYDRMEQLNLIIRDLSTQQAYPINRLRFRFMDIETVVNARPSVAHNKRSQLECVSAMSLSPLLDDHDSRDTPWYDHWKRVFLESFDFADNESHEFIGAIFGCIFVITAEEMSKFKEVLGSLLSKIKQLSSIRWIIADFVRFYLVISDDTFGPELGIGMNHHYDELISIYPNCFWLKLQNNNHHHIDNDGDIFHGDDSSHESNDSSNYNTNHVNFPDTIIDPLTKYDQRRRLSSDQSTPPVTPSPSPQLSATVRQSVLTLNTGQLNLESITSSAIDSMLREFISKALIPWAERQIRLLNDNISQRRGFRRSILGATKTLLNNMSSSTVGLRGGNMTQSVIYSAEAPEMQQRKVGDLAMALQMYDLAYSAFHSAKKEFLNESAFMYYAGATEACAIASYYINKLQREYFDKAINSYVETCKAMNYATRATILATEVTRNSWPNEAANLFIRMTGDDSDLRSAMFLEQASKCFMSAGFRTRKAAFHYVLAGHRYNRCGLKHFALACYRRFNCSHWAAAADHVNLTIARLYLSVANSTAPGLNRFTDYKYRGLEMLRVNCNKQVFYNEFIREVKKDLQSIEPTDSPSSIFYLQIPFIKSIIIEPIIGSYEQQKHNICFVNEEINIKLELLSPFNLEMHQLKLYTDNSSVICSDISANLDTGEESFIITLSVVPQIECDFQIIGIEYRPIDNDIVMMRCEISDKMRDNLKFRSIRTLPLIEIDITTPSGNTAAGPLRVFTDEIIDISITMMTKEIGWTPTNVTMTTNANVIDDKRSDVNTHEERIVAVDFDSVNAFKIQIPSIETNERELHSQNSSSTVRNQIYFKLQYFDINQNKSRISTKSIHMNIIEFFSIETIVENVVSITNTLPNDAIVVWAQGNEPIQIPPLLTAHVILDAPFIPWSIDSSRNGIIRLPKMLIKL